MRLPLVQITVRRLMTVVGVVGLGLGVLKAIEGNELVWTALALVLGPAILFAKLHEREAPKPDCQER